MNWSLENYGYRAVLRAWSVVLVRINPYVSLPSLSRFPLRSDVLIFSRSLWEREQVVLLGPLVYYLKPRIPTSRHSTSRNVSFGFLSLRAFWMYQIPNVIQGLGYFIPNLYLPCKAFSELPIRRVATDAVEKRTRA